MRRAAPHTALGFVRSRAHGPVSRRLILIATTKIVAIVPNLKIRLFWTS
jgi:hypothetical protein